MQIRGMMAENCKGVLELSSSKKKVTVPESSMGRLSAEYRRLTPNVSSALGESG